MQQGKKVSSTKLWLYYGQQYFIGWAIFGIFFGVVVAILLSVMNSTELAYANEGVMAKGKIVAKEKQYLKNMGHHHLISYTFQTKNGETYEGSTRIVLAQDLKIGGTLPIVYVESDPTLNRSVGRNNPEGYNPASMVMDQIGFWASIAIIVGSIIWILIGSIYVHSLLSLLRKGTLVAGQVTDTKPAAANNIKLQFDFQDSQGNRHEGTTRPLPRSNREKWKEYDSIDVVYDPKNPNRFHADVLGVREWERMM